MSHVSLFRTYLEPCEIASKINLIIYKLIAIFGCYVEALSLLHRYTENQKKGLMMKGI